MNALIVENELLTKSYRRLLQGRPGASRASRATLEPSAQRVVDAFHREGSSTVVCNPY